MSSAAKALANRQNSLHSTGPATAEGKAGLLSQNALHRTHVKTDRPPR